MKITRQTDIEDEWDDLQWFLNFGREHDGEERFAASFEIPVESIDDWTENKAANLVDEYAKILGVSFEAASELLVARPVRRNRELRRGARVVFSFGAQRGDLEGTVLEVKPLKRIGSGGVRAKVRVRWDNGHEATLEDRKLKVTG